jgi:RNA polymerase sigma-70 factor, ECF subfamily
MMVEITNEEIKRLQNGEKTLFNRVIMLYKKLVAGMCYKYLRSKEDATDAAQEVFVQLYTSIGKFEFKSKFSTWVYRVSVNYCINRLKSLKRRRAIEQASTGMPEEKESAAERIPDAAVLPDEQMEAGELKEMAIRELKKFPDKERTLVILRDMEGLACEEIGKIMNMPVGSVKSLAARTREKLRKIIMRKLGVKNEMQ